MGGIHSLELGPVKLTNISKFYNSTNHLEHAQPTWGWQLISGRNIWIVHGRPTNKEGEHEQRGNHAVLNQSKYRVSFYSNIHIPSHYILPRSASVQEIGRHGIEAQVSFLKIVQRFVSLIISRFQNINPEKEGKTVNGPADVKSELRMITVEDKHFSMWKEFIKRHHRGELINPDSGEMFKEKKAFILSSKFQLTRKFFKHFGHFTNDNFKVYV